MKGKLIIILSLLFSVITFTNCNRGPALKIVPGVDACLFCNMVIDNQKQACGYIEEGEFLTFDAPNCLVRLLEQRYESTISMTEYVFLADYNTGNLHRADSTFFLLTRHRPTVMNSQVLCFAKKQAAESIKEHDDEILTDWHGYIRLRGTPDKSLELVLRESGLHPETIVINKNDLVLLRITADNLEADHTISIKGYPEVGKIVIPMSGEVADLRLLALRPGAGFPIMDVNSDTPLGMVKVLGAHTMDEEEM